MRVVDPIPLTIANTNVAAPTEAAYDAGTTYAVGAVVTQAGTDGLVYRYESAKDANTGNPLTDETSWTELGACNRDAMFDARASTQTERTGGITVQVQPGRYFDQIALKRVENCTSVDVLIEASGSTLYAATHQMLEEPATWAEFFFSEKEFKGGLSVIASVFRADASVTITLNGAGDVRCGLLMLGFGLEVARTLSGVSIGIEDYSEKDRDIFGRSRLLERDYADVVNCRLQLSSSQADNVKRRLAKYRAKSVLYDFNEGGPPRESLLLVGIYESFEIPIESGGVAYCTMRAQAII